MKIDKRLLMCCALLATVPALGAPPAGESQENDYPYKSRCIEVDHMTEPPLSSGFGQLCSEMLKFRIVNESLGQFTFSTVFPPTLVRSEILLKAVAIGQGSPRECSSQLTETHSIFKMESDEQQPNCSSNQLKLVEWNFNYVFTGCYVVEVGWVDFNCTSLPLYLESQFQKEPIALRSPRVTHKFVGNGVVLFIFGDLLVNDCGNPRISSSCLEMSLYSNSCSSGLGRMVTYCVVSDHRRLDNGSLTTHCSSLNQEQSTLLNCSCNWRSDSLDCTFPDVPPGNYCVELEIADTRCVPNTLWTRNRTRNSEACLWNYSDLQVKNNAGKARQHVTTTSSSASITWLASLLVVGVALCGFLSVCWYLKSNTPPLRSSSAVQAKLGSSRSLITTSKVLLLYARECTPFMEAMTTLRTILQQALDYEVEDIWDNSRREEIDQRGATWAMSSLWSDEVQVVLVASPSTVQLERSILKGVAATCSLRPDSRDALFLSAFKTAMEMIPPTRDKCRKFIVIRINSRECYANSLQTFQPLNTIYTLPRHLDKLILHLLGGRSTKWCVDSGKIGSFSQMVQKYENFISSNPLHLENIPLCH